ncbi:hypothetical protein LX36DRAFT_29933 [Colletotrichum falcatum]|nr:hypothetical protein LX36DRAFT_29933 [Colletotrichum falcatum]
MQKEPVIIKRTVLKIWKQCQLPVAQVLVTTLAQSVSWQDGFNVQDPGGSPGMLLDRKGNSTDPWYNDALVDVMRAPYFCGNLQKAADDMNERKSFIDNQANLLGRVIEELSDSVVDYDNKVGRSLDGLQNTVQVISNPTDVRLDDIILHTRARGRDEAKIDEIMAQVKDGLGGHKEILQKLNELDNTLEKERVERNMVQAELERKGTSIQSLETDLAAAKMPQT